MYLNSTTEEALLGQAASAVAQSTGMKVSTESLALHRPPNLDAILRIGDENNNWRFLIETKRRLSNESLGATITTLTEQQRKHGPIALFTSYINPVQAEKLRDHQIAFFDLAGNVFLKQGALHVYITGRKQKGAGLPDTRRTRAFNPTGLRLVFALLCRPGLEAAPYRQMADEAGISLGAVGWVINDLKSLGYVSDSRKSGRQLRSRERLLTRWVESYPENLRRTLLIDRFHREGAWDWWQDAKLPNTAYWSGEVAAQRITNFLKPQAATIYAETNLVNLQAKFALRRHKDGEIELLRKFWPFETWERKEDQLAPPLIIYADLLMTADERNLNTARILYDRYIARLVK